MADYWPQIITAVSGLMGTVVGGLITWGVQHKTALRARSEKRRSLEVSLPAEVDSFLDLMDHRNHVQNVTAMIAANRAGAHTVPGRWITDEERKASAFPIFDANIADLGLLDDNTLRDLATFHRRVAGVRATIIQAMEGGYDNVPAQQVADIMERELGLWKNAVALGRSVAGALRDGKP